MPERFKVVLTMQGAIQVLGFSNEPKMNSIRYVAPEPLKGGSKRSVQNLNTNLR